MVEVEWVRVGVKELEWVRVGVNELEWVHVGFCRSLIGYVLVSV